MSFPITTPPPQAVYTQNNDEEDPNHGISGLRSDPTNPPPDTTLSSGKTERTPRPNALQLAMREEQPSSKNFAQQLFHMLATEGKEWGKTIVVAGGGFGIPLNVILPFVTHPVGKILTPFLAGPMLQLFIGVIYGESAPKPSSKARQAFDFLTKRLSFEFISLMTYGLTTYQNSPGGKKAAERIGPEAMTVLLGLTGTVVGARLANLTGAGGDAFIKWVNGRNRLTEPETAEEERMDDAEVANCLVLLKDRVCAHLSKPETWKEGVFDGAFLVAGNAALTSGALKNLHLLPEEMISLGVALGIFSWALAKPVSDVTTIKNLTAIVSWLQKTI